MDEQNDCLEPEILDAEEILEENKENTETESKKIDFHKAHEELTDKFQRTLAEFDNFRKRTTKEKSSMYDCGVVETVEKLLPTIDNFERAINAATDKNDVFFKGVEMIYRQLLLTICDMGVDVIETKGEKFNPNFHNAVAHVEDESFGENEIIEELQKGYKYKEKVIRHSMVKVAN